MVCGLMPDPWIYSILFGQETNSTAGFFFFFALFSLVFFSCGARRRSHWLLPGLQTHNTEWPHVVFTISSCRGCSSDGPPPHLRRALITKSGCFFFSFFFFFFFYDSLAAVKPGVVMRGGGWGSGHRRLLERM